MASYALRIHLAGKAGAPRKSITPALPLPSAHTPGSPTSELTTTSVPSVAYKGTGLQSDLFHWGLSTNPCRVPTYMQGNSGVSCWQDFLCVCRGWRGAYTCEASALGSAVKILSATHPNNSPGLGLWTGHVMLTTCPLICLIGAAQTVFMSRHPEKRVFVCHTVDVTA